MLTMACIQMRLRASFPKTKFSVLDEHLFEGESRFWVSWTKGPTMAEVHAALDLPQAIFTLDRWLPVTMIERAVTAVFWAFQCEHFPLARFTQHAVSLTRAIPTTHALLPYAGQLAVDVLDAVANGAEVPALHPGDVAAWLESPVESIRLAGLRAAATLTSIPAAESALAVPKFPPASVADPGALTW